MRKLILLVAVVVLAGCITRPQVSREEYISMTTRTYEGVTKKQVFKAAENFLRLLDGDDFIIEYPENRINATRDWFLLLSHGRTSWEIKTSPSIESTKVDVHVKSTMNASVLPTDKVVYDVFWARMDYLLGKRNDWLTCEKVSEMFNKKETWGDDFAVCNGATLKNNTPEPKHIVAKTN